MEAGGRDRQASMCRKRYGNSAPLHIKIIVHIVNSIADFFAAPIPDNKFFLYTKTYEQTCLIAGCRTVEAEYILRYRRGGKTASSLTKMYPKL
jgi:hypothetical protein